MVESRSTGFSLSYLSAVSATKIEEITQSVKDHYISPTSPFLTSLEVLSELRRQEKEGSRYR